MARATASPGKAGTALPAWNVPLRAQMGLLVVLVLVLYANTLGNGYALDDKLVIVENPDVQQGVAGLPGIFSNDAYAHHYESRGSTEALSGGRYRPLSIATFAMEWALFSRTGPDGVQHGMPAVSHAINVALYALIAVVLLVLLHRHWLPDRPLLAFTAAFLFIVHPVHTEVVTNIKGRDELLSVLFLLLAALQLWRYVARPAAGSMVLAVVCFFLALLAKENGITFLAVLPLALWWSRDLPARRIALLTLPFLVTAGAAIALRVTMIGFATGGYATFMNDPYLFATPGEHYATIMAGLLAYIKLLLWPHPLTYEYGYRHFPYVSFGDPVALFSVLLYLGLVAAAWYGIRKRQPWAFGIAFYLLTLSIVSNLVVPTGTSIGERFLFLPSIGAMIAVGALMVTLMQRLRMRPVAATVVVLAPLTLLAGTAVIQRNPDWKDDLTLVLADVEKVPDCVKANSNAGTELLLHAVDSTNLRTRDQDVRRAMGYLERAIALQQGIPRVQHFPATYLDLGTCHVMRKEYVKAAQNYLIVEPDHLWFRQNPSFAAQAFLNACVEASLQGDFAACDTYLERAGRFGASPAELAHNRGDVAYRKGDMQRAREQYTKWVELAPQNADAWMNLGGFLFTLKDKEGAIAALTRVLELVPDHPEAAQALAAARML